MPGETTWMLGYWLRLLQALLANAVEPVLQLAAQTSRALDVVTYASLRLASPLRSAFQQYYEVPRLHPLARF